MVPFRESPTALANKIRTCFLKAGGTFDDMEAKMVSRTKPKTLSEADVRRFLKDAQAMMKTINGMSVRVDSEQYRAMRDLGSLIWETAKVVAGNDRPWPVYCSVGPC
jgi:hypothetical protein